MHNNYVKINFEKYQQDTQITQNRTGLEAVDSCFAIIVARQSDVTDREALLKNYPLTLYWTPALTESSHIYHVSTRGQESKCRVDVLQRKYRMDLENRAKPHKNEQHIGSIKDLRPQNK